MARFVHAAPTSALSHDPNATRIARVPASPALLSPQQKILEYAARGCLRGALIASPTRQQRTIDDAEIVSASAHVSPELLAQAALLSRSLGSASRVPALLCALLSMRSPELLARVFPEVINTPALVRRFVGVMRSGVVGRRSLGTRPKRLVCHWLRTLDVETLFRSSLSGTSLVDVIRLVHPRPRSRSRAALYRYLLGRPHSFDRLPAIVRRFELAKRGGNRDGLSLRALIALNGSSTTELASAVSKSDARELLSVIPSLRRRGLADAVVDALVERLSEPSVVDDGVMPTAVLRFLGAQGPRLPERLVYALQRVCELAIVNVPAIHGDTAVLVDLSASMNAPLLGSRDLPRDMLDAFEVAALIAVTIARRNPETQIFGYAGESLRALRLDRRSSIAEFAETLRAAQDTPVLVADALAQLPKRFTRVVAISDSHAWVPRRGRAARVWREWRQDAGYVGVELAPISPPVQGVPGVLNVAGFSDQVFGLLAHVGEHRRMVLARDAC